MAYYSRLAKIEKRKARRKIFIYGFLTIFSIVIVFFYGVPFLSKFASFIMNISGSNSPIQITDTTPPAPPRFDSMPDSTNKTNIRVSGSAEPGASVIVSLGSSSKEVVADSDGQFSLTLDLKSGTNYIKGRAKDKSGNESADSKVYSIEFDNTPPDLEITKPQNSQSFAGQSQKQVSIEGTTEPDVALKVNDRVIIVSENGSFSTSYSLEEGENTLDFVATDRAGNQTEQSLTVNFSP
jgi:hypothetical protein